MQHQEFEVPEALSAAIKCFWYTKIDFEKRPYGFEVTPDGYAEIIFHFGSACRISFNGISQPLPSPSIMGLLNQPVQVHSENDLEILGIRCYPWTVFDLLGLPSGKDRLQIFDHPIARLHTVLKEYIREGRIGEAVTQLKHYFLQAGPGIAPDDVLFKAGIAMGKAGGSLPVSQVAAAAHATVRTLERKFKQSSGFTVKDVSALMRFEQVRNQLWLHPNANLAGLAHELGYTDQSHLSREFKRYSGTTPAAFARHAKKQIANNNFVVFVQA